MRSSRIYQALNYSSAEQVEIRARILKRTEKAEGGCWIWSLSLYPNGYPMAYCPVRKSPYLAHRMSYAAFKGEIPSGMTIDHLCREKRCCNPAHLEVVTPRENLLRSSAPAASRARQTHCLRGHPFNEQNTYIKGNGCRACKACFLIRSRARAEKKRNSAA